MRTKIFAQFARAGLVWVALIAGAMAVRAQVDTGSIVGTVTDSAGAVVSGAMVTVVNEETAAKLTARTEENGRYVFTPLQIGTYSVLVEAGGFKKATIQHDEGHLVCYLLTPAGTGGGQNVKLTNQFGHGNLNVNKDPKLLCVPSTKREV